MAEATQTVVNQVGYNPEVAPYLKENMGQARALTYNYKMGPDGKPIIGANGMPEIESFKAPEKYGGQVPVMAPSFTTQTEVMEMVAGKRPNPNKYTISDAVALGKNPNDPKYAKKNEDGTPVMAPKMDAEGKPVTEFKGYERQAEFSDLQKQAMQGARDMVGGTAEVANQSAQDIMKTAANTAAGSTYDPSAFANQYTAPDKLDYTAKEASAKEAGIASLPSAQAATAATMGKAPTGIAAIAEAKQDLNAPQMTAQTGEAAKGIAALNKAAPEMKAQAANAATLGAAPEAAQQQFAGPKDVKAQQVGEERINAPNLKDLRMDAAKDVAGSTVESRDIKAAKDTGLASLKNYQMGAADKISTDSFAQPGSADAYMSPYMQSVVGIQQREAQRAADVATTGRRGEQTRAGAFGGSRAAIMDAEAARNLATQKGDIQAQGSQEAYKQAQQQFNTEQAQGLQAQTANQQAGLTVGTQNLTAQQQTNVQNEANRLQAQGLTSSQAMQAALANQGVEQQSNVQNLSAGLQKQGLGAQIGMQAQQSNQQYNMQGKLANQQTDLAAQQANQGMEYNTNAQNAQLRQQTELANQGQKGQYGMQQGQFNQAANMQTSAQAQEAARQNQAMAGQYGLSDTGNRQQTNMADAGYAQQTGMANLANRQEAQRQNQASNSQYGLANLANRQQAEMTNAGYRQQTGMADQALAGQYGMQQGTMDQQAEMQSAANRQAAQMYYGQAQNERDQYNTTNKQQTELANQAARNRAEEFGAGQELTSAQYNAQYGLSADQLNEQSNQYGAGYGLQGMQAGMTGYGNLSNVGNTLYGQDTGAMNMQNQYGTQRQNNATGILQNQYGDWQAEQNDPYKQVSFYSDVVRGMPATAASNTMSSAPAPSMLSQVGGFGAAALGAYGAGGGFKANGGMVGRYAKGGLVRSRPQGLVALAIHSMT